jgi:hypothetical protein
MRRIEESVKIKKEQCGTKEKRKKRRKEKRTRKE